MGHTGNDFFTVYERKAIKAHKCQECRREIKPGSKYVKIVQVYDGDFHATKNCLRCHRIFGKIWKWFDVGHDEGPLEGELLYWIKGARRGAFERRKKVVNVGS